MNRLARVAVSTLGVAVLASLSALAPAQAIVGGSTVRVNTGTVSIEERTSFGMVHTCSGSLISARWVVTAAHCIKTISAKQVRAGSTQRSSAATIPVARTLRAPLGDLGLVELSANAPGPYYPWSATMVSRGTRGEIQGFGGLTTSGSSTSSSYLKSVSGTFLGSIPDSAYGNAQMVQLAPEGGTTAKGDSGGAALANGVLVGALAGIFGGYPSSTSLSNVASWIQQTTGVAPVGGITSPTSAPTASPSPTSSVSAAPSPTASAGPTASATQSATPAPSTAPTPSSTVSFAPVAVTAATHFNWNSLKASSANKPMIAVYYRSSDAASMATLNAVRAAASQGGNFSVALVDMASINSFWIPVTESAQVNTVDLFRGGSRAARLSPASAANLATLVASVR